MGDLESARPLRQAGAVSDPIDDPVLVRREQIRRLSDLGQRIGYVCFALGVVLFVIGFILQFPAWLVTTIIVVLVLGSSVLLPGIIFGYAAKAADSEDRGEKFGY
jgi:uncharacterized membrane protein HdeD (DUF308 family)